MDIEKPRTGSESPTAIVALTRHAVELALRLQPELPSSVCYVPVRHRFALAMGARGFQRLGGLLGEIWPRYSAFVFIMAAGIAVRRIAPLIKSKLSDPAVVVLDERGQFVVSLLSGHLGGANQLALKVARLLGAQPVITTASDVWKKPAMDLVAQEAGLEVENPEMLARLTRAFLEDEEVWVFDPEGRIEDSLGDYPHVRRLSPGEPETVRERPGDPGAPPPGLWVHETVPSPEGIRFLLLRPQNLVVGIGCNRGTPMEEMRDFLESVFREHRLSLRSVRNLASVDLKSREEGMIKLAETLRRPIRFYSREELRNVSVPNPSLRVANHIGVHSVCEAAAILSAQSPTLLVPKQKTPNVTLAVARADCPS
ncbi:MAG TPA: cobalt-precorrin 5A hydrolase [Syntrophobacteraceae bacterium]|nr:cobalt-precorrin 5A hydrolase [Syntrophobacteraceae bacterium]